MNKCYDSVPSVTKTSPSRPWHWTIKVSRLQGSGFLSSPLFSHWTAEVFGLGTSALMVYWRSVYWYLCPGTAPGTQEDRQTSPSLVAFSLIIKYKNTLKHHKMITIFITEVFAWICLRSSGHIEKKNALPHTWLSEVAFEGHNTSGLYLKGWEKEGSKSWISCRD